MTEPISAKFEQSKQVLMQTLPEVANELNMQSVGSDQKLGLMSFRQDEAKMFYVHIIELESGKTLVSIAPGLSYLKDRSPNTGQKKIIEQIMNNLTDICEQRKNN